MSESDHTSERTASAKAETIMTKDKEAADRDMALADRENALADKEKALAGALAAALADKDKALADKDKALADKDKALAAVLADKDKALAAALADKDRALAALAAALADKEALTAVEADGFESVKFDKLLSPPKFLPYPASSLNSSSSDGKARKSVYDKEVLPQWLYENSFVHVKMYFDFVHGCSEGLQMKVEDESEAFQCFAGNDSFRLWCPKENTGSPKELKRSLALSRAFGRQLQGFSEVDVQHQVPISSNEAKTETADIGFFWLQKDSPTKLFAVLDYKTDQKMFENYETQASAYGTSLMGVENSPVIVIQANGMKLESTNFRVFGILPQELTNDTAVECAETVADYRKAFLYEGEGKEAFVAISQGLVKCASAVKEGEKKIFSESTFRNKITSVASMQTSSGEETKFVKSYDYRLRKSDVQPNDRRHANIELVRKFIDEEAQHFSIGDSLDVVITHFYAAGKDGWFSDFPVGNLQKILNDLDGLHKENGFVHGDIRLFNLLLHAGKIVDFDHSRKQGSIYPITLQLLHLDGKRAKEVEDAIKNDTLSNLQMKVEHDWESMKSILDILGPASDSPEDFKQWWESTVEVMEISEVKTLANKLDQFQSYNLECRQDFKDKVKNFNKKLLATGTPPKKIPASGAPQKKIARYK